MLCEDEGGGRGLEANEGGWEKEDEEVPGTGRAEELSGGEDGRWRCWSLVGELGLRLAACPLEGNEEEDEEEDEGGGAFSSSSQGINEGGS